MNGGGVDTLRGTEGVWVPSRAERVDGGARDGTAVPGRVSMREVAERAGVGIASVSRVLSGHPDVSDVMRERVQAAVAELDYQPDLVAQSLRSRTSRSVGFVLSDISNPLLSEIVHGAESVLRASGFSLLLTNSEDAPEFDADQIRQLSRRRLDGLIVLPAAERHDDTSQALRAVGMPVVVVDRDMPPEVPTSYVLSDHGEGMRAAVRHLLELGHRRIGVVVGRDVRPSRERLRAIEVETDAASGVDVVVATGTLSVEHGRLAMAEMLDSGSPPTAVVLGGNLLLVGALEVLRARGIDVGPELSVVSCDDVPLARLALPPISVVARDAGAMGRAAAELLLANVDGAPPETVLLPTTYLPRESCQPPPR